MLGNDLADGFVCNIFKSLFRRPIVPITRRKLLGTLGVGASALPLSWSASARSLSLAGLITEPIDDSMFADASNANAAPGLDFSLIATPACDLSLSGTWHVSL